MTGLSDFLAVVQAMYSLYSSLENNNDRATKIINKKFIDVALPDLTPFLLENNNDRATNL
jgi:hypothetical protein